MATERLELIEIFHSPYLSQQIQDKLKELKKALEHYAFDESQMAIIDGNFQTITKVLSLNIKNLEEFKGYDGYGYFFSPRLVYSKVPS